MKPVGVVQFPGTNCDRDVFGALEHMKKNPQWLWHADLFNWRDYSALVLPGGFSYGDYLRSGALAAQSRVMQSVREAAAGGLPVLGICNGFQILCEARLLPGVLMKNAGGRFIDEWLDIEVVNSVVHFASRAPQGQSLRIPIAHGDGRWAADEKTLKSVQDRGQIWFQYKKDAPNGSLANVAGLRNEAGNVAALMPHPERAIHKWMSSTDGVYFFENIGV